MSAQGQHATDVLFIGDPWETLDHPRDSTLHLAHVAKLAHGVRSFWAVPEAIYERNSVFHAHIDGEIIDGDLRPGPRTREFASFHSVHWRADPPVTLSTFRLWSLLASSGGERGVIFLNAPHALLTWNEKFAPMRFRDWALPGLAAESPEAWRKFFEETTSRGGQVVAKPSGDAASRGVTILPAQWSEAGPLLARLRQEHGPWLVLQEFDRALLTTGETRVITLGAEICGAINKTPHPRHLIMNLDAPDDERPRLSLVEPSPEQHRRASEIARTLASEGVYLATIDFIGERVLEINVTSPGLIRWLDERLEPSRKIAQRYWAGVFKTH